MQKPRARIVRLEADRYIVSGRTNVHNITLHRVLVVVFCTARASNDPERMLKDKINTRILSLNKMFTP